MPQTAEWIDGLRAAFGAEEIDAAIREGLKGQGGFYAAEGGHELGDRRLMDRTGVVRAERCR